jgi:tetratricopeptide repeat protein 30
LVAGSWQETKFKDAIRYYDPIVKKSQDNILSVPAIVLANLCVSHIMTSQNEQAEELMKKIEREVRGRARWLD